MLSAFSQSDTSARRKFRGQTPLLFPAHILEKFFEVRAFRIRVIANRPLVGADQATKLIRKCPLQLWDPLRIRVLDLGLGVRACRGECEYRFSKGLFEKAKRRHNPTKLLSERPLVQVSRELTRQSILVDSRWPRYVLAHGVLRRYSPLANSPPCDEHDDGDACRADYHLHQHREST